MLRATLLIAGKDLRQRVRDRSGLVIAFVAPFVLAAIIGLAFGSGDGFRFSATYAVADADRGPLATRFVDGVLAGPGLAEVVTLRHVGAAEARDLVDRGDADAAFLVPAGFSASVQRGGSATITVLESGANPVAGQVARSLAEGYAAQVAATGLAVRTALDAAGRTPASPGPVPPGPPLGSPGPPRPLGFPGPLRPWPEPTGWPSGWPPPSRPCGWSSRRAARPGDLAAAPRAGPLTRPGRPLSGGAGR